MILLPKRFILTLLEAAGGERRKEKIDLMYSQTEEQPKELTGGSLKNQPSVKMSNNLAHCPVISLLHLYQVTHHGEGRVYSIHTV